MKSPLRSTVSTPAGGGHWARVPAQSIVPPRTITTESAIGAAPVPSRVVPTSARGGGGVPGVAENAVVTAIFHPASAPSPPLLPPPALPAPVLTKKRSEIPESSRAP